MKQNYIAQGWLVLVLALCFGGSLAGVQSVLSPRIAKNKLDETISQIPVLVPGATSGERKTLGDQVVYRALDDSGNAVGWVLPAGGQGFADRIEVLLGLDAEAMHITGLYVLEQRETPGLGNRIIEDDWRVQFTGKATVTPLVVTKTGATVDYEVDGVTGATISSKSVVDIVNRAIAELRRSLGESDG